MTANLYPYITFTNAKEALQYYATVFDATDIFREPVSPDQAEYYGLLDTNLADTTFHGGFSVAGTHILCSDAFMADPQASSMISILLDFDAADSDDVRQAQDLFKQVTDSETVRVTLPYSTQTFGGKMGQFVDQYGITWMIRVEDRD